MTTTFEYIYANEAARYDRLAGREDQRGNLFAAVDEIRPFSGLTVADLGAGTGRLTRMLSLMAETVIALDMSAHMLGYAHTMLQETGLENWRTVVAENAALPLPSQHFDLVIEGWSFGHVVGWYPTEWQRLTDEMLAEARRILRPGGTLILIETLGTGTKTPYPPTDGLARLYTYWEEVHHFQHRWVRTDYQFESVAEAVELTGFFFGDELAQRVQEQQLTILPECTGLWWLKA